MSSATLTLTILFSAACLFLPKRHLSWPYIVAVCLIPMNQRLFIGGLDFTVLRILLLTSILRILICRETKSICWSNFDKLILAWNLSNTLIYSLQWGTVSALLNRFGLMFDSLGMYWLFRHFFRSFEEIVQAIRIFAICALLSTPLVAVEKFYESSPFSVFGPTMSSFHRDRFRCAGPFPHYILMGVFWSSMLPLFYAFWKGRLISTVISMGGILAALSLVYFSASSTPILTVGSMVIFWLLYSYRQLGKKIFLAVCCVLILLHIIMEAPVWHLMARSNIFGGSTGWHRYHLFDEFIKHTSEWFFLGTKSTAHWGHAMSDITNQYVLEGVRGGIVTLLIFTAMLYNAVKVSGHCSLSLTDETGHCWIAWGVCISILGHFVTFWGVSYFGGQMLLVFYMQLAIVGFLAEFVENSMTFSQAKAPK